MKNEKRAKEKNQGKHSREEEKVKKSKAKNKTEKPKKKVTATRIAKRIVVTILCLMLIAGTSYLGYGFYNKKQNGIGTLSALLATLLGESSETIENLQPIQVLIMGISGVDDYKLADTIMVASYNPKTQEASIMSIPRDTYVGKKDRTTATSNYIASYKINTVFRSGTKIPDAIQKLEEKFAGEGRVLIRPSGTEPLVRVMIEGKDQQVIQEEAQRLASLIQDIMF